MQTSRINRSIYMNYKRRKWVPLFVYRFIFFIRLIRLVKVTEETYGRTEKRVLCRVGYVSYESDVPPVKVEHGVLQSLEEWRDSHIEFEEIVQRIRRR